MCRPIPLGSIRRLKNCKRCQICETLLMNCIFSVFKLDLIKESHSQRVLFLSTVTAGRDRGLWREYVRVSCIVALRSCRLLTLHVHTGSSSESFVLFNPSTISQSPTMAILCYGRTGFFTLPDGLRHFSLFLAVVTIVIDLYCINMLTNGPL